LITFPSDVTAYLSLIIGLTAYFVYKRERRNEVKNSATVVLLALRQAEKTISIMKETGNIDPRKHRLVRGDPWSTHNHLLADHFDQDELEVIDQFFKNCALVDRMLEQLYTHPQIQERVLEIQRTLCKIAYDSSISDSSSIKEAYDVYKNKKNTFLNITNQEETVINPKDPLDLLRNRLGELLPVTTTTAGNQLKRLASSCWQR